MLRLGRFAPLCWRRAAAGLLTAWLIVAAGSSAEAAGFSFGGRIRGAAQLRNFTVGQFVSLAPNSSGVIAQRIIPSPIPRRGNAVFNASSRLDFSTSPLLGRVRLELTTDTRSERTFSPAAASVFTSQTSTTAAEWIPVLVVPTRGEPPGTPVEVTLTVTYTGTRRFLGPARNQIQMGVDNVLLIDAADPRGTTATRTVTFDSAVGSTFLLGMSLVTESKYGAAMSGRMSLDMSVR